MKNNVHSQPCGRAVIGKLCVWLVAAGEALSDLMRLDTDSTPMMAMWVELSPSRLQVELIQQRFSNWEGLSNFMFQIFIER